MSKASIIRKAVKGMSKTRLNWKAALTNQTRAMKLWHSHAPRLIPATLLSNLFRKALPFVTLWFSARVIDALLAGNAEAVRRRVIMTLVVTAILGMIAAILNRWYEAEKEAGQIVPQKILSDKISSMDFADADSQHVANLYSQIQQTMNWSGRGLFQVPENLNQLTSALVTILCGAVLSAELFLLPVPDTRLTVLGHPLFSLALVILMVLGALLSGKFSGAVGKIWTDYHREVELGNRLFFAYYEMDDPSRAPDMRFYRQGEIMTRVMTEHNPLSDRAPIAGLVRRKAAPLEALSQGFSLLVSVLIYLFICLKAWGGAFAISSATQYIGAVTGVFSGISALLIALQAIRSNGETLENIFELLDIPNGMYQGSLTTEKRSDNRYEIEFRDVSFRYPGAASDALSHVSMKLKIGEKLAIVGMNGGGKTTFIKLLCRLYDPTEGTILLNGIDIRKYRYDDYMKLFSIVFQDFQLFALPLGENVAAASEYDPVRVKDCLEKAGAENFLKKSPAGLNTWLYKTLNQNGVDPSGGEAQKIALARALYRSAPIIVLDEPTAALDPVAEAEIYEKFSQMVEGKTAVYISHRLSSCKFCDEIAVFHEGRLVQQGTHDALLRDSSGKYAELWNAQAQYYT